MAMRLLLLYAIFLGRPMVSLQKMVQQIWKTNLRKPTSEKSVFDFFSSIDLFNYLFNLKLRFSSLMTQFVVY